MKNLGDVAKPDGGEPRKTKFGYADGLLTVTPPPADRASLSVPDKAGQDSQPGKLLADMRISLKLVVPSGIEVSSSTHLEGDTVTLYDMQVGKMMVQKEQLEKIVEAAKTNRDTVAAEFAKLDGVKVKMKKSVTVSVK